MARGARAVARSGGPTRQRVVVEEGYPQDGVAPAVMIIDYVPAVRVPSCHAASRWQRLSRREETWSTAEILNLRHQLAVLRRRQPRLRMPKMSSAQVKGRMRIRRRSREAVPFPEVLLAAA